MGAKPLRMITLYLLENNIDFDDLKEIEKVLNTVNLDMQGDKFYLNNVDVTTKIREKRINENVSKVASIKIVRDNLVNLQRKISNNKNVILDGRDIGTVVFPNAKVKIFFSTRPRRRSRLRPFPRPEPLAAGREDRESQAQEQQYPDKECEPGQGRE